MTVSFDDVAAKVEAGESLDPESIRALGSGRDIITLGMLADSVRRKLHGPTVTYVRVLDLELDRSTWPAAIPEQTGELRIFQTPKKLEDAIRLVESARELAGDVPFSAFCVYELSKLPEGLPVALTALRKAGLEMITQAPFDRLTTPERSLEAVSDAGLSLARLTINETPARDWTSICQEISACQQRLQSIRVFAPLARSLDLTQPTTGYGDVKRTALARVLIQNVETIQVDWRLYGPKLAQVALMFGVNDIDSVSPIDDDTKGYRRSPVEEIRRSVEAASLVPAERDGVFNQR